MNSLISVHYFTLCVILTLGVDIVVSNLQCYDCDYSNTPEGCKDPKNNPVPTTICQDAFRTLKANDTLICVSVYAKVTNNATMSGVARGCKVLNSDVEDFCEWYKEENSNSNVTITDCRTCGETKCNDHVATLEGTFTNSAPKALHYTIFVLVLNALICTRAI